MTCKRPGKDGGTVVLKRGHSMGELHIKSSDGAPISKELCQALETELLQFDWETMGGRVHTSNAEDNEWDSSDEDDDNSARENSIHPSFPTGLFDNALDSGGGKIHDLATPAIASSTLTFSSDDLSEVASTAEESRDDSTRSNSVSSRGRRMLLQRIWTSARGCSAPTAEKYLDGAHNDIVLYDSPTMPKRPTVSNKTSPTVSPTTSSASPHMSRAREIVFNPNQHQEHHLFVKGDWDPTKGPKKQLAKESSRRGLLKRVFSSKRSMTSKTN